MGKNDSESLPNERTEPVPDAPARDKESEQQLYEAVYRELRHLAARYLRMERPNHTLQPTALVNEACARLLRSPLPAWTSKEHLFAVATRTMRHVLVDYARDRTAGKRGGAQIAKLQLESFLPANDDQNPVLEADQLENVFVVNEAIDSLASANPRQAKVVELRFFTGLTLEETADIVEVDARTVQRDWQFARACLYREIIGKK